MMHIHPVQPDEIAAFAAVGTAIGQNDAVHAYLDQMVAQGAMRPEWCFIARDHDRWVGRIGYWTLPRVGIPLDIVLLDLPWEGEYLAIGTELLRESVAAMRAAGALDFGTVVDSPPQWPQWQDHLEQRDHLLTQLGFLVERETLRFTYDPADVLQAVDRRLQFRSLNELGEAAFLDAIERVSAGSLDQRIKHQRATDGPSTAAQSEFTDLQGMEYEPQWWQLAYDANGALVGLVMPARAPTFSTIGYIGVVPEQRGQGYIADLLAQGTTTLLAAGASTIRTDTDVANTLMVNAFLRAGYRQFATRREYRLSRGATP